MSTGYASGWDVEVKETGGDAKPVELVPAGAQPGLICAVLEVGTHDDVDTDGRAMTVRRVVLGYELMIRKADGSPHYLSQELTYTMGTSSNLYKLVSVLVGPPKTGQSFNPSVLLGKPVMVNMVHNEGKSRRGDSRTYANIGSVSPFPQGFPAPAPVRPPLLWGTFEGKPIPDVSYLPPCFGKNVRSIIEASHEYRSGRVPTGTPATVIPAGTSLGLGPQTDAEKLAALMRAHAASQPAAAPSQASPASAHFPPNVPPVAPTTPGIQSTDPNAPGYVPF